MAGISHDIPTQTRHATPYRITMRHIYPRIYHATHPQKSPPGAARRVSRILWTLATLTRGVHGAGPHPWRAACTWQPRTHGGPIPRYTIPNTPRHTASQRAAYILGYTTQPIGRNRRRVPRAAFLASSGHSQRSRRPPSVRRRKRPMPQRAKGGYGTRPQASGDPAHTAHSAGGRSRRPHVRSNRKRAATQPIPRTARAAAHGGRTCVPTRKEGTKTPCSN